MASRLWVPVASGPLARYAAGYVSWLAARGYSRWAVSRRLWQLDLLSRWLEREGFSPGELTAERVGAFLAARRVAGYSSWLSVRSAALPLEYLRELGVVLAAAAPAVVEDPLGRILADYRRYLVDERGLTELPVARYEAAARLFLTARVSADGSGLERLEGADVSLFLAAECPKRTPQLVRAVGLEVGRKSDVPTMPAGAGKRSASAAAFFARGPAGPGGLKCATASFVPPRPLRELRDLVRYRKAKIQERTREVQRVEKTLQDAGIKLSSVASEVLGVSARRMLDALISGTHDPEILAELAKGSLRKKIPALREALQGRFTDHHALLIGQMLAQIDFLDETIQTLSERVEELTAPFSRELELLDTIPGVDRRAAEMLLAEIGPDMSQFPTEHQLASWAGLCPGQRESGGKKGSGKTLDFCTFEGEGGTGARGVGR